MIFRSSLLVPPDGGGGEGPANLSIPDLIMWLSLMTFSKLPEMQSSSAIPTSLRTQNGGEVTHRLGATHVAAAGPRRR